MNQRRCRNRRKCQSEGGGSEEEKGTEEMQMQMKKSRSKGLSPVCLQTKSKMPKNNLKKKDRYCTNT